MNSRMPVSSTAAARGTPAGVGIGRSPQRWLQPGEELVTWVEGIGETRQRFK